MEVRQNEKYRSRVVVLAYSSVMSLLRVGGRRRAASRRAEDELATEAVAPGGKNVFLEPCAAMAAVASSRQRGGTGPCGDPAAELRRA